jgi:hypothetical protein
MNFEVSAHGGAGLEETLQFAAHRKQAPGILQRKQAPGILPRIKTNISPGPARRVQRCSATKVSQLLTKFQELEALEKQNQDFFEPQSGSAIKGILNCQAQMDSWDMKRRHRYADVLMADKWRDHELEIKDKLRVRRREQLNSSLDGTQQLPSLLPVVLEGVERELFHRKVIKKRVGRSKSCEPDFEMAKKELPEKGAPSKLPLSQGPALITHVHGIRAVNNAPPASGWTKQVDLNTGRYYYFHLSLGLTSWDPPPQFAKEYERYSQLRQRKKEEEAAQEEMLELKLLIEDHPEIVQTLKGVGTTDTSSGSIDQLMGASQIQTSLASPVKSSVPSLISSSIVLTSSPLPTTPSMRDLEDMASAIEEADLSSILHQAGDSGDSLVPSLAEEEEAAESTSRHVAQRKLNASQDLGQDVSRDSLMMPDSPKHIDVQANECLSSEKARADQEEVPKKGAGETGANDVGSNDSLAPRNRAHVQ